MYKKTIGACGIEFDSQAEAEIGDHLFMMGIEFEPHKPLPKPSRQKADFYLPDKDLWVEYDGLIGVRELSACNADKRRDKKYETYEKLGLNYIVLTREDWKDRLNEAIFFS